MLRVDRSWCLGTLLRREAFLIPRRNEGLRRLRRPTTVHDGAAAPGTGRCTRRGTKKPLPDERRCQICNTGLEDVPLARRRFSVVAPRPQRRDGRISSAGMQNSFSPIPGVCRSVTMRIGNGSFGYPQMYQKCRRISVLFVSESVRSVTNTKYRGGLRAKSATSIWKTTKKTVARAFAYCAYTGHR